jgi:hypothetical protein
MRKAKIVLNAKKSEFISSKVMKNTRVYALLNIIQHTAEILYRATRLNK